MLPSICLFLTCSVLAQEKDNFPQVNASVVSLFSSGEDLPFWMTSNQNGVFSTNNSNYQLLQLGIERGLEKDSLKKWGFFYGSNLVYGLAGRTSDFKLNQYWMGARYKWIVMKAGAQSEPVLYSGLSSTNGNMDWSNNARPLPGISLSTDGFIPFFFFKEWFDFKALYSENLLFDNRYVEDVHLHHKYLIGRASFKELKFTFGLDHWVYWGGNSPDYGELQGFSAYFKHIIGLRGGSNSPRNEKNNASGNSLGVYLFTLEREYRDFKLLLYYNHPFEDRSGLEMDNLPDGLWGIHYSGLNKKRILGDIVYEFQNTTNQSGTYNMVPVGNTGTFTGRGNDNYFNNWIYKSGHVHYNRMMGSPVFIPVIGDDGISKGFDNTRIWLHHIGLSGWGNERLSWKTLLSWSRGFGTYDPEGMFPSPVDQFSFLFDCRYYLKNSPLSFNIGVAGDYGERFEKRFGGYAGLALRLNQKRMQTYQ